MNIEEMTVGERDKQLGRYRSKTHPDWVIYLVKDSDTRVDNRQILMLDETRIDNKDMRWTQTGPHMSKPLDVISDLVDEWFKNHPYRPWLNTPDGAVWELKVEPGTIALYIKKGDTFVGADQELSIYDLKILEGEYKISPGEKPQANHHRVRVRDRSNPSFGDHDMIYMTALNAEANMEFY